MKSSILTHTTRLRSFVSILAGIFIGGLAGIGAMILFAPRSGKETRTQIRVRSEKLQDRATETFDELIRLSQYDNRKILAVTGEKADNSRF